MLATHSLSSEKVLGGRPLNGFALSLRSTLGSSEVASERLPPGQPEKVGGVAIKKGSAPKRALPRKTWRALACRQQGMGARRAEDLFALTLVLLFCLTSFFRRLLAILLRLIGRVSRHPPLPLPVAGNATRAAL